MNNFENVSVERKRIANNIVNSYSNASDLTTPKISLEDFQKSLSVHDIVFRPQSLIDYLAKSKEAGEEFFQKANQEIAQLEKSIVLTEEGEFLAFVKRVKSEDIKVK